MSANNRTQNYKLNQSFYSKNKKKQTQKGNFNNHARQKPYPAVEPVKKPPVKISFLGGLNEIGKNITVIECNQDIVIVDCGMAFPDGDMLGVDLVIPDFSYIEQNVDRVR